jgi:hypothetical protein
MMVGFITVTACSIINDTMPFTIVAEGEPLAGKSQTPILLAIRGDDPSRTVPDGLPDKAKDALKEIFAKSDSALYIVIFDGWKSSTGYHIRIDSIVRRHDDSIEKLIVKYHVEQPSLGGGTAFTYPFVIARVNDNRIRPVDVTFEGPSHPTPASIALSYDIVAYGAPTTGSGDSPITLGIRGSEGKQNLPDSLPEQAKQILQKIFEQADSNLYIVIYAGRYPGTDYKVGIDFIEERREGGKEQLVVRYRIDKPLSTSSTASYPFLIVRIKTNIQTGNIIFEHQ